MKVVLFLLMLIIMVGCEINIDPSIANTPFGMHALRYEYIIALISLGGGILCLMGGVALTIMGFSGSVEWIVEAAGFTSKLINASPGIALMVIGFWLTLKSRMKVKAKRKG